jgi:hypothetical protein
LIPALREFWQDHELLSPTPRTGTFPLCACHECAKPLHHRLVAQYRLEPHACVLACGFVRIVDLFTEMVVGSSSSSRTHGVPKSGRLSHARTAREKRPGRHVCTLRRDRCQPHRLQQQAQPVRLGEFAAHSRAEVGFSCFMPRER